MSKSGSPARRVAFLCSNETPWGGSEELWFETALALAAQGCSVTVLKPSLPVGGDRVPRLQAAGCRVRDLTRPFMLGRFFYDRGSWYSTYFGILWLLFWAAVGLVRARPDFVIVSQGGNWDGVYFGILLKRLRLRYVAISQAASEFDWPPDSLRSHVQNLHRNAEHSFFVSRHNRELTELQTGGSLPNASVARNPFLVRYSQPLKWPSHCTTVRLACVARLYPMQKGQDLLLQILAEPKWRSRNIHVTFYGEGDNKAGLEGIARMLELQNVTFAGQVTGVEQIWRENHALILPSRAEGLPLVIVEAMLAGRVVISTNAGGSAEVIDDNVCGFVSDSCSAVGFADALDRAWARLEDWPEIGAAAASHIRRLVPPDPGGVLAREILGLMESQEARARQQSEDRPGALAGA